MTQTITVEYGADSVELSPGAPFDIGREADLSLGNNRFLHRRLLRIVYENSFWWLINIGASLAVTVSTQETGVQAWLGPGARLPLTLRESVIVFTAGSYSYEIVVRNPNAPWRAAPTVNVSTGETTLDAVPLTDSQRALIVAFAEPMLRREGGGVVKVPSNRDAAERLGWTMTRLNRKLDNVCDKLDRLGVEGLRGGPESYATNRRARLVEYAISTGLVKAADLELLDRPDPWEYEADEGEQCD